MISPYCSIEGCERFREGRNELCASHAALNRKADRQIKTNVEKLENKKEIKKVSEKRAAQEKIYFKRVAIWKKGKKCGVRGCIKDCDDAHHQKGREGALLLDEKYWFPVCRLDHTRITTDSKWAIENGYSLPRNHE